VSHCSKGGGGEGIAGSIMRRYGSPKGGFGHGVKSGGEVGTTLKKYTGGPGGVTCA